MAAMRTRYPAGISRNTVLLAFASLFADLSSEMLHPIPLLSGGILYWGDEQAPRVAVSESSQRQATP